MEGVEGLLCRFLGEFRFVGKNNPLPILEVLALENRADDSQRRLCQNFANAMEELRLGLWHEAGIAFEAILQDYPEDGPSRFHLARCRRYVDTPPDEPPWVVNMDAK